VRRCDDARMPRACQRRGLWCFAILSGERVRVPNHARRARRGALREATACARRLTVGVCSPPGWAAPPDHLATPPGYLAVSPVALETPPDEPAGPPSVLAAPPDEPAGPPGEMAGSERGGPRAFDLLSINRVCLVYVDMAGSAARLGLRKPTGS
jgi:hypothetical protein